ncbi:hypothetical protein MRX96_005372 [Rhipicephalus microplus]
MLPPCGFVWPFWKGWKSRLWHFSRSGSSTFSSSPAGLAVSTSLWLRIGEGRQQDGAHDAVQYGSAEDEQCSPQAELVDEVLKQCGPEKRADGRARVGHAAGYGSMVLEVLR